MAIRSLREEHLLTEAERVQARPVFILGIAERSGTTYLQDLLRVHPDCDVDGLELEEDHFTAHSDLLVKYVNLVSQDWKGWWGAEQLQKERDLLCQCLGDGLVSYLRLQVRMRRLLTGKGPYERPLRVLVTKTPSVTNLHLFFRIFPDADLLILVRDGRAVVESAVRTFYRSFAEEARRWAKRSAAIRRFAESQPTRGSRYLIVRYEDLYTKTEEELRRVMSFLRLDPALYDFEAARNLPVRGSSSLRREGAEWPESFVAPGIHWSPVPKTVDFRPLERWSNWNRAKHERFNWIAGRNLAYFDYQVKCNIGNRWPWAAWNIVLDTLPIEAVVYLWQRAVLETRFARNKSDGLRRILSKLWSRVRLVKSRAESCT